MRFGENRTNLYQYVKDMENKISKKKTNEKIIKKNYLKEIFNSQNIWIIFWSAFSILWIFIWSRISSSNELNMKNLEIEKEVYVNFLNEYYSHFDNEAILNKYKYNYERYIRNNFNDDDLRYFSDWFISSYTNSDYYSYLKEYNDSINESKDIKECYFGIPLDCVNSFEESAMKYNLRILIWETQRRAMVATLTEQIRDFKKKTVDASILMPKSLYDKSISNMSLTFVVSPNPFNSCEWITNSVCWFDFSTYLQEDENTTTFWFNFIDESIVDYFRERMKKYLKYDEVRWEKQVKKPKNIKYQ